MSLSFPFVLPLPRRESFDFFGTRRLRGPPSRGARGAGSAGEPCTEGVAVVRRIVGIMNCGGVSVTCPKDAEREC